MNRHWMMALSLAGVLGAAGAQERAAGQADSIRLGALHQQAVTVDPRQREIGLLSRQTDLRLSTLAAERLPTITADAYSQYQSDVFQAPVGTGFSFPAPEKDMYDGRLSLEQSIFDPTLGPRRATERAQLAESQAQVRTGLFGLRQEVNDAFFSAAELERRSDITAVTITDLERRLGEATERVRAGAALPSDTAAIQATLVQRRQDELELAANRRAALARLTQLTGRAIGDREPLALPDLAAEVVTARSGLAGLRARPEYETFARTRERLAREEDVTASALWPKLSAFARVGYGRPGLSPINTRFDSYYVTGVRLSWAPWTWGSNGREREALAVQREIVAADEAAFTSSIARSIQGDLATVDRLDTTLVMDDHIIRLREQVETEARARFREGVITASEYLDRSTDVLEARLAQATHRVQLAQARARLLTTLGVEIR